MVRGRKVHHYISIAVLIVLGLVTAGLLYINTVENRISETGAPVITEEDAVHDFVSCVAAGNPIMESYPERCAANGQTFTNSAQEVEASSGWNTTVASGQGAFEITFPDGFGEIIKPLDSDGFYVMGLEQPDINVGGEISIQETESFGTDSLGVFSAVVLPEASDTPRGTPESYTLVNGKENPIEGKKYIYIYEEDELYGMGHQRFKGDRDYAYVFNLTDGRVLMVTYNIYGEDPSNNSEVIDQIVDSIKLK